MARYDEEAIQKCFRLYLKYNGAQHERIEAEMRKVYPGWRRALLYSGGRGQHLKIGWIERFGWEKALQLHLAQKPTAALNSAQQLVNEIEDVRKRLYGLIKAQVNSDKELLQFHRDYGRLSIEALTKVAEAKDTFGAWVSFWTQLLDWMPDIDIRTAKGLVKFSEQIIAMAEKEFGETEEMVENLMNGDETTAAEGIH